MEVMPNGSLKKNTGTTIIPSPPSTTQDPQMLKELERIEFYKTYDVMTGIRIAATLSGFFGLMVILVLYKSKSKTEKAMEDPDFTAAAVADAEEEEERQLAAVLEAAAFPNIINPRKSRRSLDTYSISPSWKATRFSSFAGYSSLMEPPTKTHSRLPSFIDEDLPLEDDKYIYEDIYYNSHLEVPRRASNITCSSSASSYLERRDSSILLGLSSIIPEHQKSSKEHRRQSSPPILETYDFYYPIDIKVIQPTPGGSPCGSGRILCDNINLQQSLTRMAPLASISSCNSSLGIVDYSDADMQSCISDSVFCNDEDTDNEIEPFSTDSELSIIDGDCFKRIPQSSPSTTTIVQLQQHIPSTLDNNNDVPTTSATAQHPTCSQNKNWGQETLF